MWVVKWLFSYYYVELHKNVVTLKPQGELEYLQYICGREANHPIKYPTNIYGTFRNKICMTKPPALISILPN